MRTGTDPNPKPVLGKNPTCESEREQWIAEDG